MGRESPDGDATDAYAEYIARRRAAAALATSRAAVTQKHSPDYGIRHVAGFAVLTFFGSAVGGVDLFAAAALGVAVLLGGLATLARNNHRPARVFLYLFALATTFGLAFLHVRSTVGKTIGVIDVLTCLSLAGFGLWWIAVRLTRMGRTRRRI